MPMESNGCSRVITVDLANGRKAKEIQASGDVAQGALGMKTCLFRRSQMGIRETTSLGSVGNVLQGVER